MKSESELPEGLLLQLLLCCQLAWFMVAIIGWLKGKIGYGLCYSQLSTVPFWMIFCSIGGARLGKPKPLLFWG